MRIDLKNSEDKFTGVNWLLQIMHRVKRVINFETFKRRMTSLICFSVLLFRTRRPSLIVFLMSRPLSPVSIILSSAFEISACFLSSHSVEHRVSKLRNRSRRASLER